MPRYGLIYNLCKNIEYKLMFNGVFRSLVETFLLLSISTLTELSGINDEGLEVSEDAAGYKTLNFWISVGMTVALGLTPFLVACLLLKKFASLRIPETKSRYDSLYGTVNYYYKPALMFKPLFLLRRFLFASSVTFLLSTNLFIQVISIEVVSMVSLGFFIGLMPMDSL